MSDLIEHIMKQSASIIVALLLLIIFVMSVLLFLEVGPQISIVIGEPTAQSGGQWVQVPVPAVTHTPLPTATHAPTFTIPIATPLIQAGQPIPTFTPVPLPTYTPYPTVTPLPTERSPDFVISLNTEAVLGFFFGD